MNDSPIQRSSGFSASFCGRKKRPIPSSFIFFLILALASYAIASENEKSQSTDQDNASFSDSSDGMDPEAMEAEEVVVTEAMCPGNIGCEPAFTQSVDLSASEERVVETSREIEKAVGTTVSRYGGFGTFSTVSLRGSNTNQVGIFLDGIALADPNFGVTDISNYPSDIFDRADIYRGYIPARFGAAPIGGVVDLSTRTPKPGKPITTLIGTIGSIEGLDDTPRSMNLYRITASDERWIGPVNWVLLYSRWDSDNEYPFLDDNTTPYNKDDDKDVLRANAEVGSDQAFAKIGVPLAGQWYAQIMLEWFQKDQGVPGRATDQSLAANYFYGRLMGAASVENFSLWNERMDFRTIFSYREQWDHYNDKLGEVGSSSQDEESALQAFSENVLTTLRVPEVRQQFTVNLEAAQYRLRQINNLGDTDKLRHQTRDEYRVTAEDILDPLDGRLQLAATLRSIRSKNHHEESVYYGHTGIGPEKEIEFESDDFTFGFLGSPFRGFYCKASYGRYLRQPNFYELYGDRGAVVGNDELLEETGTKWDAGLSLRVAELAPKAPRIEWDAAYFENEVEDIIVFIQTSSRTSQARNFDEAFLSGLESRLSFSWPKRLDFSINGTRMWTENRSIVKSYEGKELPGRPHNEVDADLSIHLPYLQLFGSHHYEDGKYIDPVNVEELPVRRLWNAGITGYPYKDHLALTFEIQNIGNEKYEDAVGFPLPGRIFLFTVKGAFSLPNQ